MYYPNHENYRLILFGLLSFPLKSFAAEFGLDTAQCCMLRAREEFSTLNTTPWEACGIGTNPGSINPLITSTLAWCKKNCNAFNSSNFNQWSDLLTTFLVPALALLILCSVGSPNHEDDEEEEGDKEDSVNGDDRLRDDGEETNMDHENDISTARNSNEGRRDSKKADTITSLLHEMREEKSHLGTLRNKKRPSRSKHIWYLAKEYVNLLGDPASAIAGSAYQLWWEYCLVREITAIDEHDTYRQMKEDAYRFALLAGQTHMHQVDSVHRKSDMTEEDILHLSEVFKADVQAHGSRHLSLQESATTPPQPSKERGSFQPSMPTTYPSGTLQIQPLKPIQFPDWTLGIHKGHSHSSIRGRLDDTIRILLKAKLDFTNGIAVPMILTYGGCAAAFYAAYQSLGDRDKAFSLSFGVSYGWLLILSLVGNSYAVTVNSELLESSLAAVLYDPNYSPYNHSEHGRQYYHFYPLVIPFRKRIPATELWSRWIDLVTNDDHIDMNEKNSKGYYHSLSHERSRKKFFVKFVVLQLLGWAIVSFYVGLGALISYNTPTIGLGCHSFSLFLYIGSTLITSLILWVRSFAENQGRWVVGFLKWIYSFMTLLSASFLVGGTVLDLIGVFRNCRCERLFGNIDTVMVVLNDSTELDIQMARSYWLPVGVVAFCTALGFSTPAILIREYTYLTLGKRFLRKYEFS